MTDSLTFRAVTLNVLHDPPHLTWRRRAPLVVAGLVELQPDIVLLQEVAWPDEQATALAVLLAQRLDRGYTAHLTGLFATTGWREGLAILSWFPRLDSSELEYPDAEKFCQRVRFAVGGRVLDVYNCHLDPYSGERRQQQVKLALEWMGQFHDADAVIFGGDLNGIPTSPEILPLQAALCSAYATVHGEDPPRIIDYLWASRSLAVVDAGLTMDQPALDDPALLPSDHLALYADFSSNDENGTTRTSRRDTRLKRDALGSDAVFLRSRDTERARCCLVNSREPTSVKPCRL